MKGKLKAFGLMAIAALAMSAMMATTAQASEPEFTAANAADYPVSLLATGTEGERFTSFGGETFCGHGQFDAELTGASDEVFVTPIYSNCSADGAFGTKLPVTVTHNGCQYRFHSATEESADAYNLETDIVCSGTNKIEVHVYSGSSAHSSGNSMCTLTIGSQTGLAGPTADVDTGAGDVTLEGSVTGITAQQHRNSFLCPSGTHTSSSVYHLPSGGVTVEGESIENEAEADIHIG